MLQIAVVHGTSVERFFRKTVAKEQQSVLQPVRAGAAKLAILKSDFLFGKGGRLIRSPCFDPQKIIGDRVEVQLESAEQR
jgi:hypothetical protein